MENRRRLDSLAYSVVDRKLTAALLTESSKGVQHGSRARARLNAVTQPVTIPGGERGIAEHLTRIDPTGDPDSGCWSLASVASYSGSDFLLLKSDATSDAATSGLGDVPRETPPRLVRCSGPKNL